MSFGYMLYSILILPIESVIEMVFTFSAERLAVLGIGGAVFCVSMAVNFLALPLYNIADALQLEERKIQSGMQGCVRHIKKAFKGDEQYMVLNAYYRLNGYNPLYSLRSSLSILIEIPFFIAAYHYLSNCEGLKNQSFLFIKNLGEPDEAIRLLGLTFNLLPILMTLINCISGWVYSKGAPLREKVQIYVLAAIFLVLLYQSPSGLVFYWILNNIFSLIKNIVQKYCKKPGLIVVVCIDTLCVLLAVYYTVFKFSATLNAQIVISAATVFVLLTPLLLSLFGKWYLKRRSAFMADRQSYFASFLFSAVSLLLLSGAVLPSSMIASSPVEFSFLGSTDSPLAYIAFSLALSLGLFVVWPLAVYQMFGEKVKYGLTYFFVFLSLVSCCSAFIFRQNYGTVNVFGVLDNARALKSFSPFLLFGPVVVVLVAALAMVFLEQKRRMNVVALFMLALSLAFLAMTAKNCRGIRATYAEYRLAREKTLASGGNGSGGSELPTVFSLSRTKKNVFVLFLDRAIGIFAPYIFQEFPELKEIYSGFVFYPNTVSFADSTNKGAPALYGGYEYTPEQMNLRKDELLLQKNNEALLLLPRLFSEAGWQVTDFDPADSNYSRVEDFTPFEGLANTKVLASVPGAAEKYKAEHAEAAGDDDVSQYVKKAVSKFAFMQMLVPVARKVFYNDGEYFSKSYIGLSEELIKQFSELYYLPQMTDFSAERNTYTIMHNLLTHEPAFLNPPYYMPKNNVSKVPENLRCAYPYSPANIYFDLQHYEVNAAALLQVAKWIQYLKSNSCYDNTRIIIVSDHGFRDTILHLAPGFSLNTDYASYQPLLMFKDFDSTGEVKTDNSFMTNADTVELSLQNLGLDEINPFTHKKLTGNKTNSVNLYNANVKADDWSPYAQKDNTQFYLDCVKAFHVQDNIFDESNWVPLKKWFDLHPEEKQKAIECGVKVE